MKMRLVFALLVLVVLAEVEGNEKRKHKKYGGRHHKIKHMTVENEEAEIISMMEQDEAAEKRNKPQEQDPYESKLLALDPCYNKHCGPGKVCKVTETREAECVCINECPQESNPRRKVCSNFNETWGSDCALHQMRCWCQYNDERCASKEFYHMHIEYYGECKEMEECTKDEMDDFPRRMRDWLFNVMRDLADREELSPYYTRMEREAELNLTKRWTNAAVWKWCDLEVNHDRAVSRHELFPIRGHLMSMEHCIAPFLNSCDLNDDHKITLSEWAKCLGLDEDVIEEKCEEIRDDKESEV